MASSGARKAISDIIAYSVRQRKHATSTCFLAPVSRRVAAASAGFLVFM